jgi:hypothetical protein
MYCHCEEMDFEILADLHIVTPSLIPKYETVVSDMAAVRFTSGKTTPGVTRWAGLGWVATRGFQYPVMKKILSSSVESIPQRRLRGLITGPLFSWRYQYEMVIVNLDFRFYLQVRNSAIAP